MSLSFCQWYNRSTQYSTTRASLMSQQHGTCHQGYELHVEQSTPASFNMVDAGRIHATPHSCDTPRGLWIIHQNQNQKQHICTSRCQVGLEIFLTAMTTVTYQQLHVTWTAVDMDISIGLKLFTCSLPTTWYLSPRLWTSRWLSMPLLTA